MGRRHLCLLFLVHCLIRGTASFDCDALTCVRTNPAGNTCTEANSCWTYRYGTSVTSTGYHNQEADLYLPDGYSGERVPVVVLIHGGYWREGYRRSNPSLSSMDPLATDLRRRGFASISLEYRRASTYAATDKGGYNGTFLDAAAAIDALACLPQLRQQCEMEGQLNLDVDRVAVVGHSAGGHLALWASLRDDRASVVPLAAVGLAAVSDFLCPFSVCDGGCVCHVDECTGFCPDPITSAGAISDLMASGVEPVTDYGHIESLAKFISPIHMLPTAQDRLQATNRTLQVLLIHGTADTNVGPQQSANFVAATTDFPNVDASEFSWPDKGHFDVTDPSQAGWVDHVVPFLETVFGVRSPTGAPTNDVSPTDTPTDMAPPTDATESPTDRPADAFTDAPTDVPTDVPTDAPTDLSTNTPTDATADLPVESAGSKKAAIGLGAGAAVLTTLL